MGLSIDRSRVSTPLVVAVCVSIGSAVLLFAGRHMWFFFDEWDFLVSRSISLDDLFRPHNEHWSTLPVLAYRLLFSLSGISSYWPYFGLLVVLHAAIAVLVITLLLRHDVPLAMAVASGVLLLVLGTGAENLLWAFQIGFVGSLAFFLGALVLLTSRGSAMWKDVTASLLLIASLMCSGLGVALVGGIVIALLTSGEFRRAILVGAPPTLVYLLWFVVYRDDVLGAHDSQLLDSIWLVPRYVATALAAALDGITGLGSSLGWILLLVLVAAVIIRLASGKPMPMAVTALLVAATAVYFLAALGRAAAFGIDQAAAGRYVHVGAVLLLPAGVILLATSQWWNDHDRRAATAAVTVVLLAAALANLSELRTSAREFAVSRESVRTEMDAALAILGTSNPEVFDEARPVEFAPDATVADIRVLTATGKRQIQDASLEPSLEAGMLARMQMLLAHGAGASVPATIDLGESHNVVVEWQDDACVGYRSTGSDPWIVFHPGPTGSIEVVPSVDGAIQIFRTEGLMPFSASGSIRATGSADVSRWLLLKDVANSTLVRVDPPDGSSFEICGATVAS